MRHAEAGQAGLGFAAAADRAFVADLAAGAGGRTRPWRDRGRVVVGFHLDRVRHLAGFRAPHAGRRIHAEAAPATAGDHRGVVAVGRQRVRRMRGVGGADHAQQGLLARLAVQRPVRVEHLVPAVFRVGLREHHQFGVGGVAAQCAVAVHQILDFIRRQRQTQVRIGGLQRRLRVAGQRDVLERAGLAVQKQTSGVIDARQHRLGHAVVQHVQRGGMRRLIGRRQCIQRIGHAALDARAADAAAAQDVAGLG